MTQVRKDTGFVRSIRRIQQATYPAANRNEVPTGISLILKKKNNVITSQFNTQFILCNVEPVMHPAVVKPSPVEKPPSLKGNWLSGIIEKVKPPSRAIGGEPKTPKSVQTNTVSAIVDDSKSTTRENAHRNRRESRLALRVERRSSTRRSSSLDTVSTCLTEFRQDSDKKKPYRHAKAANMVLT